jgi:hypothetical protein
MYHEFFPTEQCFNFSLRIIRLCHLFSQHNGKRILSRRNVVIDRILNPVMLLEPPSRFEM